MGKALTLVGSMTISVFAYAYSMGSWSFAVGLVGLLFVHEMGHVYEAERCGVKASWPLFVPFVGAAIFIKKFHSIRNEARVGIAGPVLGSIGTLALLIPYWITGDKIWLGLMFLGFTLNLFNLIPLRPLDGGRITAICGPKFKLFGIGMLAVLSFVVHQPVMLYVWVLVLQDIAFPLWWRPTTAGMLSVAMIVLMALGYSTQGVWPDRIDSGVALIVSFLYYCADKNRQQTGKDCYCEAEEFGDERSLTAFDRLGWAVSWGTLALTLGGALWWLSEIGYQ